MYPNMMPARVRNDLLRSLLREYHLLNVASPATPDLRVPLSPIYGRVPHNT